MYHNTSDSSSNSSNPKPQDTLSNKHRPSPKKIKKKHKKSLSATYKTKKCEYYNRGNCNKGHNCTFNHNFIPDCSKKLCKYFFTSQCEVGEQCPFSHNTKRYPCKYYHILKYCHHQSEQCRYSHGSAIAAEIQEVFLRENQDLIGKAMKEGKKLDKIFLSFLSQKQKQKSQNKTGISCQAVKNSSLPQHKHQDQTKEPILKKGKKELLQVLDAKSIRSKPSISLSSYLQSYY